MFGLDSLTGGGGLQGSSSASSSNTSNYANTSTTNAGIGGNSGLSFGSPSPGVQKTQAITTGLVVVGIALFYFASKKRKG